MGKQCLIRSHAPKLRIEVGIEYGTCWPRGHNLATCVRNVTTCAHFYLNFDDISQAPPRASIPTFEGDLQFLRQAPR